MAACRMWSGGRQLGNARGGKAMARVPYLQREQLPPEQQKHFDAIAGSRGRVGPNFQTLLNSPEAGGRFAGFGEYVRFHGDVPERLKELWSITAAGEANNDCGSTAHERLARQQGLPDRSICGGRN